MWAGVGVGAGVWRSRLGSSWLVVGVWVAGRVRTCFVFVLAVVLCLVLGDDVFWKIGTGSGTGTGIPGRTTAGAVLLLDARCSVVDRMHARVHMHMLVRIYILSGCPLFPPPLPPHFYLLRASDTTRVSCVRDSLTLSSFVPVSVTVPFPPPSPSCSAPTPTPTPTPDLGSDFPSAPHRVARWRSPG